MPGGWKYILPNKNGRIDRGMADSSKNLIRQALETDAAAIDAVEQSSFIHAGERFSPKRVRYLIRSRRNQLIVAEQNGTVVGWAAGFAWRRGKLPWGRIYAIAVDPAARGRSIGKLLMQHLLNHLEREGADKVFLEVREDNHVAIRLYQKLGFARCCRLVNYYGHGLAALRMVRVNEPSPAASS